MSPSGAACARRQSALPSGQARTVYRSTRIDLKTPTERGAGRAGGDRSHPVAPGEPDPTTRVSSDTPKAVRSGRCALPLSLHLPAANHEAGERLHVGGPHPPPEGSWWARYDPFETGRELFASSPESRRREARRATRAAKQPVIRSSTRRWCRRVSRRPTPGRHERPLAPESNDSCPYWQLPLRTSHPANRTPPLPLRARRGVCSFDPRPSREGLAGWPRLSPRPPRWESEHRPRHP